MESPSPLSGWVILEQAILTLQPGSSICPMGPVVLPEKPEACWWGEPCLHVRYLAVPAVASPQPFPDPPLPPALPLGGLGKVDCLLSPVVFWLSLVANPGLD